MAGQYKKFVSKEYEAIKSGLDIINNPDLTLKDLKVEYRKLLRTYNKTNKRLSRIVEHSDRQQRQIQELNDRIEEEINQKKEIKEKLEKLSTKQN